MGLYIIYMLYIYIYIYILFMYIYIIYTNIYIGKRTVGELRREHRERQRERKSVCVSERQSRTRLASQAIHIFMN